MGQEGIMLWKLWNVYGLCEQLIRDEMALGEYDDAIIALYQSKELVEPELSYAN